MSMKFLNEKVMLSITYLGNPLILAAIALGAFGFSSRYMIALAGLVIIEAVCISIRLVYFKHRPIKQKFTNIIEKLDASSFPSGHAARAAFFYSYLAWFAGNPASIAFIALIVFVGTSRIILRKHFVIDMIAGYGLGLLVFLASIRLK